MGAKTKKTKKTKKKEDRTAQSLQDKLRKFHLNRAEEKSWGLWGWIRENKNSLVSETAVKKIHETMMFAVSEYSAMMDEAAELKGRKELQETNKELKGRLKRAGVIISKNGGTKPRIKGRLLSYSGKAGDHDLPREQGAARTQLEEDGSGTVQDK